ncbi:Hsp20/alpha crystallin family protein [Streptomyces sp. NPDC046876]|uniref:Hsp20/alpha crystallin family protein n=1 Tax=Streptomyces sp. NPDC046876 TaxID=3155616 RepID=UPI0033E034E7
MRELVPVYRAVRRTVACQRERVAHWLLFASGTDDMEVLMMVLPIRRGGGLSERLRPAWGSMDPFRDFANMWGEMGRLLEQAAVPAPGEGGRWLPMAEEEETDDAYVVRMELPGVPAENVNIEVDGNELSISGEVSEEHQGKVLSRRTGKFFYRTSLPDTVNADECDADLSDGLLTLRIPKTAEGRRHKIELRSQGSKSIEAGQAQGRGQSQGQGLEAGGGTEGMRGAEAAPGATGTTGTQSAEGSTGTQGQGLTGDVG